MKVSTELAVLMAKGKEFQALINNNNNRRCLYRAKKIKKKNK